MLRKVLAFDSSKCTGCRYCEVVCSLNKKGICRYDSLIQVFRDDHDFNYAASFCHHCEKPPCASACPTQAIARNAETSAVVIDPGKCIGCSACITLCPFSIPKIDPERGVAEICNLCDGDPACVKFCPPKALQYVPIEKTHLVRRVKIMGEMLDVIKGKNE